MIGSGILRETRRTVLSIQGHGYMNSDITLALGDGGTVGNFKMPQSWCVSFISDWKSILHVAQFMG